MYDLRSKELEEEKVTKDQLQTIEYVKGHLQDWMIEQKILPFPSRNDNTELIEKIVRVEEGIKHQNDNLKKIKQTLISYVISQFHAYEAP
jgi:hypothetical protein